MNKDFQLAQIEFEFCGVNDVKASDKRACSIELVHCDPGTEIYVCWTHRKVWEIDTLRIGSQVNNPPKTCEECEELIKKAKLAADMHEVESESFTEFE